MLRSLLITKIHNDEDSKLFVSIAEFEKESFFFFFPPMEDVCIYHRAIMNYVLKSQLKRLCYDSYESTKGDCLFDTDTCIYNAWWKQDFFFP